MCGRRLVGCVCVCRRLVECMVSKATAVKNQQAMH